MLANHTIRNLYFLNTYSIKLYQYLSIALSTHIRSNTLIFPSQRNHLAIKASSPANALADSRDLSIKPPPQFHIKKQKEAVYPPSPKLGIELKQM